MSFVAPTVRLAALGLAGSLVVLSCSPESPSDPQQTQGALRVDVSTSGNGIPSSFSVTLDGGSARSISPNGTTTYSSLNPGSHTVELAVPANCSVSGSSSRTAEVRESVTSDVTFAVTCTAVPTGAIGVTTSTTGDPPDPDGYGLTIDGTAGPGVETNDTQLLPDLVTGDHEIGLTDVADNCAVQDANPRTVTVGENQTTPTEFEIVCSATTGLIDVSVSTTGDEPDADGYTVNLDGESSQPVDPDGSVTFTGVEEGGHTLTLEDVAPNCAVEENPVSADVVAGQTTDVSFTVDCAATVGSLEVSASTSGSEIDANGYAVSVDGGPEQSLAVNGGTVTFDALSPEDHSVRLTDVAANCAVAGDNPRMVTITAGQTVSTTFDVTCSSTVGAIEVTVTTTGEAIDPDGYSVVLDGGSDTQVVDPNDVVTFGGLAPEEHTLTLQNVADNCTPDDDEQTADVVAGETAEVTFNVECEELTGTIQVNVTTTGSELDPNGYDVSVDGGGGLPIGINGSRTFQDVVIGEHDVALTDVAINCAVQGDNPRTVSVNQDQIIQVNISVECSATTGQIEVSATTTGEDVDGDGYTVDRDGVTSQPVSVNGSTTFTGVPPGDADLTLQNVADNCVVTSPNPTTTTVTEGGTSNVGFTVECSRTTGDIRVTTSSSGSPDDANGYTVSVDGDNRSIGINDTELFADLQPDDYTVTISGVAAQCEVSGSAMRDVTVNADDVTDVTFTVTCDPLEGDIQVNVSTSGEDQDDGYTARLDGDDTTDQPVSANGTVTFFDVPTGNRSITLLDVANNCDEGTNPQSTTVIDDQTVTVDFDVVCEGLTGDLEVTTSTTGSDLDPDGYTIDVDGGAQTMSIGVNGTVTFHDVADGDHQVLLTGDASNCSVNDNPRMVNVPANGTGSTTFDVTCTEADGSIVVDVSTSGDDPDTDGYDVTLNGGSPQSVGPSGSTSYPDLTPDDYDVGIDETTVADNCTVNESNPQTVTVTAGNQTNVSFTVSCTGLTGDLEVTTSTTGSDLDPDGYTIDVDGGAQTMSIGVNGTVTFQDVADGDHQVLLTGDASNCSVSNNPRMVNVPANGTGSTTFDVTCTEADGSIAVDVSTSGDDPDTDGYDVTLNGGSPQSVGPSGSTSYPDLTPDDYDVGIDETTVADNCTVNESNPQTVTVTAGNQTNVSFTVSCVEDVGSIEVTATTTGTNPDPDGYDVLLDSATAGSVGSNASVTLTGVASGMHTVELDATTIAANCSVTSTIQVMVEVTFGDTEAVAFDVECT